LTLRNTAVDVYDDLSSKCVVAFFVFLLSIKAHST